MPTVKARKTSTAKTGTSAFERASKVVTAAVGTVASRVAPAGPDDAVKLLEQDHRRFEKLLKAGEDTTTRAVKKRKELLDTLAAELVAHEDKEEKLLYPALKRHKEARDIVLEGYQEHHIADILVDELKMMPPTDERWGAKFKVLKESLEHHIEEEEGDMFKTARSVLGRDRLEEIGREMQALESRPKKRSR
jgi:hemerythrin-like domain-containing protein